MTFLNIFYLFYLGVVIPRAAFKSRKYLKGDFASAPRMRAYIATSISMALLALMTGMVAWRNWDIDLFPTWTITPRQAAIGVGAMLIKLAYVFIRMKLGKGVSKETKSLAPVNAKERALFFVLVILGATAEECAYRGLAFLILREMTGSVIISALLCAVAFGLAHAVQGNRAIVITFCYALMDHAVYVLTASLPILIITHFAYDAMMGLALSRRASTVAPAEA